ncbi:hypothetical protein DTO169E5_2234 [Paecilomyces variotii]|nr:hypothetical protein DTO169E5_2234 [Paecilomyces variotii]
MPVLSLPPRAVPTTIRTIPIPITKRDNLCTPSQWFDIASFILSNYISHAGTVVSAPGQSGLVTIITIILALFYPVSGVMRGLNAIVRHAATNKDPRQRAIQAGATCMVVRLSDWRPQNGEEIKGLTFVSEKLLRQLEQISSGKDQDSSLKEIRRPLEELQELRECTEPILLGVQLPPPWLVEEHLHGLINDSIQLVDGDFTIHGVCHLPPGYGLVYVPHDAALEAVGSSNPDGDQFQRYSEDITASYSLSKALFAIIQAIYASITLYQSRGDQIARYGYASYGLTVIPYVIMSIINLISAMVNPEYPALYMVESEIMDEARARGGVFEGTIGRLDADNDSSDPKRTVTFTGCCEEDNSDGGKATSQSLTCRIPQFPDKVSAEYEEEKIRLSISPQPMREPRIFPSDYPWHFSSVNLPRRKPFISVSNCHNFRRTSSLSTKLDFDNFGFFRAFFHKVFLISTPKFQLVHSRSQWQRSMSSMSLIQWLGTLIGCLPIAVIGGLTHFNGASSTIAQRTWIMAWLALGIAMGLYSGTSHPWTKGKSKGMITWNRVAVFIWHLIWSVPAIGGFVVVSQMLGEYESCQAAV